MKAKTMFLGCFAGAVILAMGYEYSQAQPKANESSLKIGVVSIGRALRNCKAMVEYRKRVIAENGKMDIEVQRLLKETQALTAGLKALNTDSSDYQVRYRELLHKQGDLKTLQDFNPRRKMSRELKWTQDVYKEILQITKELAREKSLDLVLGVDEPEFPIQRYEELVMTLSTHKVLYSERCVDLTNEVVARLDKEPSKFGN